MNKNKKMLLEILYIILGINVLGIFWTYAGYPIFIFSLSRIIKNKRKQARKYNFTISKKRRKKCSNKYRIKKCKR
ncbi:MAG: hypothetical protein CVT89_01075 [Candidatus Altiarchaeales archaeon HGW-Altiarchaeales-2]|nr:MAG: hypothetical protein CVT89_01075 [Candidatus Altiarchaeales archaeon HGW-Altiarchaeales-2]